MITPDIVHAWHDARTAAGWVNVRESGAEVPIADWQADLRNFTRRWYGKLQEHAAKPRTGSRQPSEPVKVTTQPKDGF
jgi:hypothetical protein